MCDNGSGERLTLYLRQGSGGNTAFRYHEEGGSGAFYWSEEGFGYAIARKADRTLLLRIAQIVYRQTAPGGGRRRPLARRTKSADSRNKITGIPVLVRPARSLPRERVQAAGICACTADVPRDPDAHRAGAGVARSSIKGFWGRKGADHDGRGAMKANDEVPAPQGKLTLGFHCPKAAVAGEPCCCRARRWSKSRHNLRNLGNVGSKCADFGTRDPRTRNVR
jgi:hypothetical protein